MGGQVHSFRRKAGETFHSIDADQRDVMLLMTGMCGLLERHVRAETVQHLRDLAKMLETADADTLAKVSGQAHAHGDGGLA